MTTMRVFVSYETTDAAFATQLMTDLREAGAEVITDNVGLEDTTFEQFLSEQLPLCHSLIMVQTPAALQSPRVRAVADSALKLVQEGRMSAMVRIIAPNPNGVKAQAVPLRWANTPEFDASQDYARALFRLCLKLELSSTRAIPDVPPPASSLPVFASSAPKESRNMLPLFGQAHAQRQVEKDRPSRPIRRTSTLLRGRIILPALLTVVVLTGVLVLVYPRTPTPTLVTAPPIQARSFAQPAFTVFNGQSYMAWTGINTHLTIAHSSTGTTLTSPKMLSETSAHGPALTVFKSHLFMAWIDIDKHLSITSSSDGRNFAHPITLGFTSFVGPALTVFNNQLYAAWTGIDNHLYISASRDGSSFAPPTFLPRTTSKKSPALAVFNNQLYAAWIETDHSLHIIRFPNATTYTGVDTPGATSTQGIALTVFNNQLYAAWTGIDKRLSIARSSDGNTFASSAFLTGALSEKAPALTVFNNQLYAAWTDTNRKNHLNIASSSTGNAFTPPIVLLETGSQEVASAAKQ